MSLDPSSPIQWRGSFLAAEQGADRKHLWLSGLQCGRCDLSLRSADPAEEKGPNLCQSRDGFGKRVWSSVDMQNMGPDCSTNGTELASTVPGDFPGT